MNKILIFPDETLRKISEEVSLPLSSDDTQLLKEMYAFVKDDENNALGISAVQIGVLKRMCVVKTSIGMFKLVNPKIIWHSTEKRFGSEGCLSVKEEDFTGEKCINIDQPISRWKKVRVSAFDAVKNKQVILEFEDRSAVVIQHELDHMNGVLYIDYIC